MPHLIFKGLIAIFIAVPIVYLFVQKRYKKTRYYFLGYENSGCQKCFIEKKPCKLKKCSFRTIQTVLNYVTSAQKSLQLCSPSFRNKLMTEAIIEAYNKNTQVRIITSKVESMIECCVQGIPVKGYDCENKCNLLHNKFIIIDGEILIKSSLNFTESILKGNCENLQIIFDKDQILWYQSLFEDIWRYNVPCYKCNSDGQDLVVSF